MHDIIKYEHGITDVVAVYKHIRAGHNEVVAIYKHIRAGNNDVVAIYKHIRASHGFFLTIRQLWHSIRVHMRVYLTCASVYACVC